MRDTKNIDWEKELDEYFASGKTIRSYVREKEYSVDNFRHRLYRDARYRKKGRQKSSARIIPIVEEKSGTLKVNGFEIAIDGNTSEEALTLLLRAVRMAG